MSSNKSSNSLMMCIIVKVHYSKSTQKLLATRSVTVTFSIGHIYAISTFVHELPLDLCCHSTTPPSMFTSWCLIHKNCLLQVPWYLHKAVLLSSHQMISGLEWAWIQFQKKIVLHIDYIHTYFAGLIRHAKYLYRSRKSCGQITKMWVGFWKGVCVM